MESLSLSLEQKTSDFIEAIRSIPRISINTLQEFIHGEKHGYPLKKEDTMKIINASMEDGIVPIIWAIWAKRIQVVHMLYEAGAQWKQVRTPRDGDTVFHCACQTGAVDILDFFHTKNTQNTQKREENSATIETQNQHGMQPIHTAAQYNMIPCVEYLHMCGADIEAKDEQGKTPLHAAIELNHCAMVEFLITRGAKLETQDKKGATALHCAAEKNHIRTIKKLLRSYAYGDLIQMKNEEGKTASECAFAYGHNELGKYLAKLHSRWSRMSFYVCRYSNGQPKEFVWINRWLFLWLFLWQAQEIFVVAPAVLPAAFHVVYAILFVVVIISLYICGNSDPGYCISPMHDSSQPLLGNTKSAGTDYMRLLVLYDGTTMKSSKICLTCRIVKPERSKHCRDTGCCVRRFDHYCPWIGGCVGEGNIRSFVLSLCIGAIIGFMYVSSNMMYLMALPSGSFDMLSLCFTVHACLMTIFVSVMAASHLYFISFNFSTNEFANRWRYEQFQNGNPYDRGCLGNWREFLNAYGHRAASLCGDSNPFSSKAFQLTGIVLHDNGEKTL